LLTLPPVRLQRLNLSLRRERYVINQTHFVIVTMQARSRESTSVPCGHVVNLEPGLPKRACGSAVRARTTDQPIQNGGTFTPGSVQQRVT